MIEKKYFLLIGILILAAFTAYIPHLNYAYPLHVDEWHHIMISKQIAETADFQSKSYVGEAVFDDFEVGYHLLLAMIQKITRLGILIPVYFPAIFSMLSVLCVFLLAGRWGKTTALISAFLAALIPSNVTIGGPSLLLPLNLTLIFTPLTLFIVFNAKRIRDYLILSLVNIFILFAHPPTAISINLLLFFYLLLNLKNKKKTRLIFLSLLMPLAVGLFQFLRLIEISGFEVTIYTFWVWLSEIPVLFGFIQTPLFILGFYLLTKHGKKEDWTILLGVTSFLIIIFLYIQTGWLPLFSYHRIYMSLFILMALVTGYGISRIKSKPFIVLVLILITIISLQQQFSTPYYHIINDIDYQNFVWIRDNTPSDSIVLLDPWKARAFPVIAERRVFTVTPFGPDQEILKINQQAYDFFNNKCANTTFLIENNINVIYSPVKCQNDELINMKDGIYLFEA